MQFTLPIKVKTSDLLDALGLFRFCRVKFVELRSFLFTEKYPRITHRLFDLRDILSILAGDLYTTKHLECFSQFLSDLVFHVSTAFLPSETV